jgi:hypothetical protein
MRGSTPGTRRIRGATDSSVRRIRQAQRQRDETPVCQRRTEAGSEWFIRPRQPAQPLHRKARSAPFLRASAHQAALARPMRAPRRSTNSLRLLLRRRRAGRAVCFASKSLVNKP